MTALDIRIQYRFATGLSPTHGRDADNIYDYKESLTHEYVEWLEEYRGDKPVPMSMTWQRNYFLKETGMHATWRDRKGIVRYTKPYKTWLEELLCKALTVLGK